jgi:hypothetical protein
MKITALTWKIVAKIIVNKKGTNLLLIIKFNETRHILVAKICRVTNIPPIVMQKYRKTEKTGFS